MRGNRQNGRVVSLYEKRFVVRSWEIDGAGRALPRIVNSMLQNVAIHHAIELGLGRGKLGESLTWMLSKMRIEMERWPHWHDEIVVKTWPSAIDRIFALRDFEVCDPAGMPYGSATSAWIVVDANKRRPMRLPPAVKELRPDGTMRALTGGFTPVPKVESPAGSAEYVVRWNDCDYNHHLGAQHYVSWALDLVPDEVLSTSWLRELDIEYRSEARPGDRVVSEWAPAGEGEFVHRLRHAEDGRDMARLRSVWSPA